MKPNAGAADPSSRTLAWRALVLTSLLSLLGSGLGVCGIGQGVVTGVEIPLVLSCVLFSAGTLLRLIAGRRGGLQTVATISTIYFALYLCAGSVIAITRSSQHFNLFIFLIWFFPLLVFNKLVNAPVVGRFLAKFLLLAPIAIVCLYFVRLTAIFTLELVFFIVAYCLSYLAFGLTFNIVTPLSRRVRRRTRTS